METLKLIEFNGLELTDERREALRSYSGWGGCSDAFSDKPEWRDVNDRLRALLNDEQYASERSSTLTAFYTPASVVSSLWQTLERYGIGRDKPAHILEPGCGTGNFLSTMPPAVHAELHGVELDLMSSRIARALNPHATVVNADLADTLIPAGSMDAVIGNVPYSGGITLPYRIGDASHNIALHDYFIERSIDSLRPGGLAILLTSRHTMDKRSEQVRADLARKAELTAAVRLPSSTFTRQAGTEAVTDVLVLRKREQPLDHTPDESWVHTTSMDVPGRDAVVHVNSLIAADPKSHVAGQLRTVIGRFGGDLEVTTPAEGVGVMLSRLLQEQMEQSGGMDANPLGKRSGEPIVGIRPAAATPYEYTVDDAGVVWLGDGMTVEPVASGEGTDARRLRGLIEVRDLTRSLQAMEMDPDSADDDIERSRTRLNERYTQFVAEFGRISSRTNRRAYSHEEMSWPLVSSLERTDDRGRFVSLSDVFTRRTLNPLPPMPDSAKDITDAFNISMDRIGRVDLETIGRLTGLDVTGALEALGDLVVTDPDTGEVVPADDYLSGDVVSKAEHVRALELDARTRVAQEGEHQWRLSQGLEGRQPTDVQAVNTWIEALGGTAWHSLLDPGHTKAYAHPGYAQARVRDYSANLNRPRLLVAAACRMIDEMPASREPLTEPFTPNGDDGPRYTPPKLHASCGTNIVWGKLQTVGTYGGSPLGGDNMPAYDTAVLLDKVVHARNMRRSDKIATITNLFENHYEYSANAWVDCPVGAAVRRCLPEVSDTRELVERVVDDPAISEYVLATTPDNYNPDKPYRWDNMHETRASAEGFMQWRQQRERFLEEWARRNHDRAETDLTRADSLAVLAGRLERVRPLPLESDVISMPLGAPWIPPRDIYEFMRKEFDVDRPTVSPAADAKFQVDYIELTGQWRVQYSGSKDISIEIADKYGTSDHNPFQLLEACLNNQQVRVNKEVSDGKGGAKKTVDQAATMAVMDKMKAIRDAWDQWLQDHPDTRQRLADIYNHTFNTIRPRQVDGSYITTPGIAEGIELRDHQKNAVARVLRAEEGTLVAHVVGAGKTFEGVVMVHEAKRLGKASKPMIVVPNHLTEQWANDFMKLYPASRILVMDSADTSGPDAARRFWGRVATGSWDAVIVPASRFSQLHVSRERREQRLKDRVDQYVTAIEEATQMQGGKSATVKRLEGARKRIETNLERLRSGKESRDDLALKGLEFERLGVDMLFVDEAHNFKNLGVPVASSDLGMQVSSAAKCEDMLDKCELLREQGHGANIVFATGTPVSNSMSELYNMQRYLAPSTLERQGTASFASWAGTYGQVVPTVELKPEGTGFQVKQRFARFSNLPELMSGVKQFSDIIVNDDIDLKLPELEQIPVAVPIEPQQSEQMNRLVERADAVRNGAVTPDVDNMLSITTDGRKIALDPKLLKDGRDAEPMEGGKVESCAANIEMVWRRTEQERGAQLVFCDTSTPASGEWNIYDDLKRRLLARGIPDEQIAFVHDAGDNPNKRETLFAKVRDGEVRVLIGSTQKLGTGTNVQDRLAAIHDLDCPWRPADLEQRLGRIQRQGNQYDHVQAYRYVAEGTFDAYAWQTVERKQRFISQIMTSKSPAREASDLDETVLSYADIKAIATGDPTIQQRMNLENEINQLKLLRQAHARRKSETRNEIDTWLKPAVEQLTVDAEALRADRGLLQKASDNHKSHMSANLWEGLELGGRRITNRIQANMLLHQTALTSADGQRIGTYNGLGITVRRSGSNRVSLSLQGNHEHPLPNDLEAPVPNNPAKGPLPALERHIRSRLDLAERIDTQLDDAVSRLAAAERLIERPWEREEEYVSKQVELHRLTIEATSSGSMPSSRSDSNEASHLAPAIVSSSAANLMEDTEYEDGMVEAILPNPADQLDESYETAWGNMDPADPSNLSMIPCVTDPLVR